MFGAPCQNRSGKLLQYLFDDAVPQTTVTQTQTGHFRSPSLLSRYGENFAHTDDLVDGQSTRRIPRSCAAPCIRFNANTQAYTTLLPQRANAFRTINFYDGEGIRIRGFGSGR